MIIFQTNGHCPYLMEKFSRRFRDGRRFAFFFPRFYLNRYDK
jgi:hypothetical protein